MHDRREFLKNSSLALGAAVLAGIGREARAQGRSLVLTTDKSWDGSKVQPYAGKHPDIYRYIDAHKDEHIGKIQRLLRQPSVSAQNLGIRETAEMVVAMLKAVGAHDAVIVPTKGLPGVWGSIDAGARRTILNYGMYDVQPVNPEEWSSPPWEARLVAKPPYGRAIIARGATNTKGALGAFVNACEAIGTVRGKLPLNLQFAIEGEEEIGSIHYNEIIDAHEAEMARADGVLFAITSQESDGSLSMNLGVKGIAYIELEASGASANRGPMERDIHSSYKAVVDSPVWRLVQGLATLTDRTGNLIAIPGYGDAIAPPSEADQELVNALLKNFDDGLWKKEYGVPAWINAWDKRQMILHYLYDTTMNIAGIWGGYSGPGPKTILPMKATAKIDTRLVPNQTPERAVELIKGHLARNDFGDLEVRFLEGYPPSKTSVATPLVQTALGVYKKYGITPVVWPHLAGSAPFYVFTERLKKPFVMFGLGHGAGAHSKDEYLVVDGNGIVADLMTTEKSYVDLLFALAEAGPRGGAQ